MFREPIAFVVGAGASFELNLPLGATLRDRISAAVNFRFHPGTYVVTDGDSDLFEALRLRCDDDQEAINKYIAAGKDLAATMATFPSVDEALHYWSDRPEIVELGKLAIARKILEAERNSTLAAQNPQTGFPSIERGDETWIGELLTMALSGLKRGEVKTAFQNVTLINFNYDRTVEEYLYHALQTRASVGFETAQAAVASLNMIRPYGSVGPLGWQAAAAGGAGIHFGANVYGPGMYLPSFFRIAEGILTYTEGRVETHVEAHIETALEAAQVLVFLGFGYHKQNMALLTPKANSKRGRMKKVFATVRGVDPNNHEALITALEHTYGLRQRAQLVDTTAEGLLSKLRLSIMMVVG